MPSIDLTDIDDAERKRLVASFKDNTAGKTIIYVEDHENMGYNNQFLWNMAVGNGGKVMWVKKAEEAYALLQDLTAADKDAPKKTIIVTDDETHSSMTGHSLIRRVHADPKPGMATIPALLLTGATVEDYHVGLNLITFMGEHAAVTGKPASLQLIARAIEEMEQHRSSQKEEAAHPLTRDEKKQAIYRAMSDEELHKTIAHREGEYRELRERQTFEEKHGGHTRMRSDKKFWTSNLQGNPAEVPAMLDSVVEKRQIEEKLETMGYARAELERRAAAQAGQKEGFDKAKKTRDIPFH